MKAGTKIIELRSGEFVTPHESESVALSDLASVHPDIDFFTPLFIAAMRSHSIDELQNREAVSGKLVPIGMLFVGYPSESRVKENRDIFVDRESIECICDRCAIIGLYIAGITAIPGGRGLTPSLGGGPKLMAYPIFERVRGIVEAVVNYQGIFQTPRKLHLGQATEGICSICRKSGPVYRDFHRVGMGERIDGINDLHVLDSEGERIKWFVTSFYRDKLLNDKYPGVSSRFLHVVNDNAAIKLIEYGTSGCVEFINLNGDKLQKVFFFLLRELHVRQYCTRAHELESRFRSALIEQKFSVAGALSCVIDAFMDSLPYESYPDIIAARKRVLTYALNVFKEDIS